MNLSILSFAAQIQQCWLCLCWFVRHALAGKPDGFISLRAIMCHVAAGSLKILIAVATTSLAEFMVLAP